MNSIVFFIHTSKQTTLCCALTINFRDCVAKLTSSNSRTNANTFEQKPIIRINLIILQWKWNQPVCCVIVLWKHCNGSLNRCRLQILFHFRWHLHRDKCKIHIVHSVVICIWMNKIKSKKRGKIHGWNQVRKTERKKKRKRQRVRE